MRRSAEARELPRRRVMTSPPEASSARDRSQVADSPSVWRRSVTSPMAYLSQADGAQAPAEQPLRARRLRPLLPPMRTSCHRPMVARRRCRVVAKQPAISHYRRSGLRCSLPIPALARLAVALGGRRIGSSARLEIGRRFNNASPERMYALLRRCRSLVQRSVGQFE